MTDLVLLVDGTEARVAVQGLGAAAGALVASAEHAVAAGAVFVALASAHVAGTLRKQCSLLATSRMLKRTNQ